MPNPPIVHIEKNVPARMRDGVTLYADVYRPVSDVPLPVLLMRLPYDKTSAEAAGHKPPLWFARHGYVVVIQDTRGRNTSEGTFYPFKYEMQDGYDTVEWAAQLPGSNGKVGTYGFSYVGATQLLAAVMQPPHLAAIAPGFTGSDYYDGWTYQGGALSLAFALSWAVNLSMEDARHRGDAASEMEMQDLMLKIGDWHRYMPLAEFPPLKRRDLGAFFYDWLAHPTCDEYWQAWSIRTRHARIQVPALHIGGWYDVFLEGTIENFQGIRAKSENAGARESQQLLIGPWTHMPWAPRVGDVDFGEEARNIVDDALIRFFDRRLKGIAKEDDPEPSVKLFVQGRNQWLATDDFPPPNTRLHKYFLHSSGAANSSMGDGTLTLDAAGEEAYDTYCHDPVWAVQSVGGHSCCFPFISPMGPRDQREVEYRNDVLVYTGEVLNHDLTVCGTVTATLYASSSARDADFAVKLVDVFPDGCAINLCDGILRARYRNGLERAELLEPDTVYELTIVVGSTCNVFKAGHRIRVEIASSNFPMYDRNPGHGGDISAASFLDLVSSNQNIFHDARYPSHLVLPVLEHI